MMILESHMESGKPRNYIALFFYSMNAMHRLLLCEHKG